MKKRKNEIKRKMKLWEKIFCLVSIIFILGCCLFYGYRLIKYYKIFNPPKTDNSGLLSVEIPKKSTLVTEGDGLYRLNGSYIYRGEVENNYLKYSGLMFRILKINYGSTIEIILDNSINTIAWGKNSDYKTSDINKYLNEYFINKIDKSQLEKMTICVDSKKELNQNMECKKTESVYSKILDSNTFLNTIINSTYLAKEGQLMWLSDNLSSGELKNVIANNTQITYVSTEDSYDIRPIISLKYDTSLLGGSGTKDDPYIINKNDSELGKDITLGDYKWKVIDEQEGILTLCLNNNLDSLKSYGNKFDPNDEKSIAYYLNNDFYESLNFKDDIIETTWEIGDYSNDYESIEVDKVKAKVGLLSIKDFKLSSSEQQYYLLNGDFDNKVYTMDHYMYKSERNLSKGIKPVIKIKASKIEKVN